MVEHEHLDRWEIRAVEHMALVVVEHIIIQHPRLARVELSPSPSASMTFRRYKRFLSRMERFSERPLSKERPEGTLIYV